MVKIKNYEILRNRKPKIPQHDFIADKCFKTASLLVPVFKGKAMFPARNLFCSN